MSCCTGPRPPQMPQDLVPLVRYICTGSSDILGFYCVHLPKSDLLQCCGIAASQLHARRLKRGSRMLGSAAFYRRKFAAGLLIRRGRIGTGWRISV